MGMSKNDGTAGAGKALDRETSGEGVPDREMNVAGTLNRKPNGWKVYGSAVFFSLIVGFSFLGVKSCLSVATPLETLTFRFNFAFLAALMALAAGMVKIDLKDKPKGKIVLIAFVYLGFMVLQAIGLVFSTSIESGIIFAVIPILAKIIASIFLKESTSWKQNVFVCLSVAAVITMFVMGASDLSVNLVGLVILTLSSLSMAISNVLMRYVREIYKPFEMSLFIAGGGCILFNLATVVYGLQSGTLGDYLKPMAHLNFVWATIYLGILSTLVTALIMAYMMKYMKAVKATIFGNLSTAISIVAGVLIMGEPLRIYHVICTILIIVGVVGLSVSSSSEEKKEQEL